MTDPSGDAIAEATRRFLEEIGVLRKPPAPDPDADPEPEYSDYYPERSQT